MSRGLGRLQRDVLAALDGKQIALDLGCITYAVAGIDYEDLSETRKPSRSLYCATARAIATLRKRGLVATEYRTSFAERGRYMIVRKR